jgi:hypothetical protein
LNFIQSFAKQSVGTKYQVMPIPEAMKITDLPKKYA